MTVETKTPKSPRNAAYGKALSALKAAHEDEFQTLYKVECDAAGIEYKVRLTAEQRAEKVQAEKIAKAKAKVAELVAQFGDAVQPSFEQDPALTEPTF